MNTPHRFGVVILCILAGKNWAFAAQPGLPPNPVRDPNTSGYVSAIRVSPSTDELASLNTTLKALLSNSDPAAKAVFEKHPTFQLIPARSDNPPVNSEGNFIIGPDYARAPEYTAQPGVRKGNIYQFTMNSTDSKIYPGIDRDPDTYGTVDPNNPYTLLVPTSHPAPYTRQVTVYVPSQYVPGTSAPLLVTADGPDNSLPTVLDNLIAEHKVPAMIAVMIAHGGRPNTDPGGGSDAQGSERGLEYDTMSDLYAEFVETEVLPLVERQYNVKLTKDPDGRATMGGSSGGAAAFTMAWYHPELYHRVLAYSGTFVNQQWPFNPATPHGAWGYHETLIPQSASKPIRLWFEVGDTDNYNRNALRDDMHDWVVANERMATVLAAKGYHYQFVFALHAGHTDRNVREQTLPEALEWLWKGYVPAP